jgi:transcription elongation GreA/GreB family factor
LLDHVVGDVVSVTVPAGVHKYRVEKIERVD